MPPSPRRCPPRPPGSAGHGEAVERGATIPTVHGVLVAQGLQRSPVLREVAIVEQRVPLAHDDTGLPRDQLDEGGHHAVLAVALLMQPPGGTAETAAEATT
eukprot:7425613-Alexandrium_andersonii.AAC.1